MRLVKNTIGHLLLDRLSKTPNNKATGYIKDSNVTDFTFIEFKRQVEVLSLALIKKGIISQDKIWILSNTRIEWNLFDLASLCAGAITVPIYHTYSKDETEYILNHCEAKLIIVENDEQLEKVINNIDNLPYLKSIISIDEISETLIKKLPSKLYYYSYSQFIKIGNEETISNPDLFEIKINSQHDNNIATIVYTSGTTGKPKGAIIKHGALLKMLKNIKSFSTPSLSENDKNLIFLPLSHVLGRCDSLLNLAFGCQSIYTNSIDHLLSDIAIIKPTFMIAVPRIFEKIYEKVQKDLESSNFFKKGLFNWAMNSSNQYFKKIDQNKTPTPTEILQYNIAKNLVFNKVYEKFGGKIRYFISGGAPLSSEIIQFLKNSGLNLVEGYGLTETIAPCILNPFSKQKPGTVGKPIGDVEVMFGHDSEIFIRSDALFNGYLKDDDETNKVLNSKGWFATGDLGEFDRDGYLKITGRKKDIIITSGGKNIAPQKIEGILKLSPLIEHCVIVGNNKKYLTALIALNEQSLKSKDLTQIYNEIEAFLKQSNEKLGRFETIKYFKTLPIALTTENYLTPSLKVKKNKIISDFNYLIDEMYLD